MSKTRTLDEITAELGKAYKQWKGGEKDKNDLKDEFFQIALTEVETTPEEKLIEITAPDEEALKARVARYYPAWEIEDYRPTDDQDQWEVILVSQTYYQAYSHTNPDDGMVYKRQIVAGPILLDDERLWEEHPDLWRDVMEIPNRSVIKNVIYECGIDSHDVDEKLEQLWDAYDGPRNLKDLDSLPPETLAAISQYIYQGPPQIKFPAPRKAKPEDLA